MIKSSSWISRKIPEHRLSAPGTATIKKIPSSEFISLIQSLKSEGWHITNENYDADILDHYSKIKLECNSSKLSFEWDNKEGGSIEGAEDHVEKIAYMLKNFVYINHKDGSSKEWLWMKQRNFICRAFYKLRFRLLGLATIKAIPTYEFRDLIKSLKSEGWYVTYEYYGEDAWVHYGQVKLRHDLRRLTLEWDDKTGGSIEGAGDLIRGIAYTKGYTAVDQWRWDNDNLTA